ncbi:hypothetical protein BGZ58_004388 [Dissophora ornata]|nr:hypothetical protein BGZ58_004388 [Dissophora ornata]
MDRYGNNIRTLIEMVHNPNSTTYSPQTKIIVICPPPIDETRWAAYRQWQGQAMDRNKDVTRQYSETCLKIGQEYEAKNSVQSSPHHCQVNVIDTWGVMSKRIESGQQSLRDYLSDGVHLTAKGNNLIFEQIMNVVRHRYPEWDPETMLMHGPWWANLDLKNPEVDLLVCANKVRP